MLQGFSHGPDEDAASIYRLLSVKYLERQVLKARRRRTYRHKRPPLTSGRQSFNCRSH